MKNADEKLEQRLEQELVRLQNLGSLVELQASLIESGELERLPRVLERKDRIIARLQEARAQYESALHDSPGLTARARQLWEELGQRIREHSARDRVSLDRAVEIRQELARKLRQVKAGKKMLLGYAPVATKGKARFKDIKT
ncbi:hypothetical protein LLH00_17410 [bacterium]|nr:hypothetical protein [bacterium]